MGDLFTLGSEYAGASETAAIFAGIDGEVLPDEAPDPPPPSQGVVSAGQRDSDRGDLDGDSDGAEGAAGSGGGTPSAGRGRGKEGGNNVTKDRSVKKRSKKERSKKDAATAATTPSRRNGSARPSGTSLAVSRHGDGNTRGGTTADTPANDGTDSNLLRDLFEGTVVMSALDHAKIEGANEPGARAIEAEAARVAKRATEALRKSRISVQVRARAVAGSCGYMSF